MNEKQRKSFSKEKKKRLALKIECPMCHGSGLIRKSSGSYRAYTPQERNKARKMLASGKTYREIGVALNIEHPQQVKSMIFAKL